MNEIDEKKNKLGIMSLIFSGIALISVFMINSSMFFYGLIIPLILGYFGFVFGYVDFKRCGGFISKIGIILSFYTILGCTVLIFMLIISGGTRSNLPDVLLLYLLVIYIIMPISFLILKCLKILK